MGVFCARYRASDLYDYKLDDLEINQRSRRLA